MNAEILPVLHVQAGLLGGGEIPVWPCPLLVTNPERGCDMAAALGDSNVGHLQGHGIVSVAADVKTATVQAIMLKRSPRRTSGSCWPGAARASSLQTRSQSCGARWLRSRAGGPITCSWSTNGGHRAGHIANDSKVSGAKSSSGCKRFGERPCSW
jgi:hypothetical protein